MKKVWLCGFLAVSIALNGAHRAAYAQGTAKQAGQSIFDGKLKPKLGAKYKMRFYIRSNTAQNLPLSALGEDKAPQKWETLSILKFNADYDIISVDGFGNFQARVTYGDFSRDLDLTINGKPLLPKQKAEIRDANGEYLKLLKGVTFVIKISPTGEVFSVYGLNIMRDGVQKKSQAIPQATYATTESVESAESIQQLLARLLSEKEAIKNFGQLSGPLPAQPIMVSESWNYSKSIPEGEPDSQTSQGTRTLVSLASGVATVKDTRAFNYDGPMQLLKSRDDQSEVTEKYVETENIVTLINNTTGIPSEITNTRTKNGTITIVPKSDGQADIVPYSRTIETRIVIEEQ